MPSFSPSGKRDSNPCTHEYCDLYLHPQPLKGVKRVTDNESPLYNITKNDGLNAIIFSER